MLRKVLLVGAALALSPTLALADGNHGRGKRSEVFYRDGCRVERIWLSPGRYEERVDCRRGGGAYQDYWDDRDDDDWRESAWHDDRYAVRFFDDRCRHELARFYGAPVYGWREIRDWRRPYWVGRPLPAHISVRRLPRDLYGRLPPPPRGHRYVVYDRDVLLIAEATRLVTDAAILLSVR